MLELAIPEMEFFDERTETFINVHEQTLCLEHSLVSLSKWEAKWHKPFLDTKQKTQKETLDYIRCMTLTPNVDPMAYLAVTLDQIKEVNAYINDEMTATWFSDKARGKGSGEIVTSEVIYWWMITLGIPFSCETWHLNRLMTLVRVCNAKNDKPRKMSCRETYDQYRALNAARKQRLHSKG